VFWRSAGARVDGFFVGEVGGGQRVADIASRTGARVDGAGLEECPKDLPVQTETFALVIAGGGAPDIRALVPSQAEPLQIFKHRLHELRFAACAIEIFVAEDEGAPVLQGALLGNPERACVSEVKVTGWGRRYATTVGHGEPGVENESSGVRQ
jgi:hypothetical protein